MKYLLSLCLLAGVFPVFAQAPVTWKVNARQTATNHYTITVTATIPHRWHVYAADDTTLGLSPVRVSWENEQVRSVAPGIATPVNQSIAFNDPIFGYKTLPVYVDSIHLVGSIVINGVVPSHLPVTVHAFAADKETFLPIEETFDVALEGGQKPVDSFTISSIDLSHPLADCGQAQPAGRSLFGIFLLGLGGGLVALLTPCVFPMIPVTVSFFTNRASTKRKAISNGILYGSFILFIYLLCSLPFHLMGHINPNLFNVIATNAWVNLFFFIVFIFFALSFFGLFEITLPSFIANSTGRREAVNNIPGIFFMALTLVIVSFSCTGPILGSLLVTSISPNGSAWQLTAGMAGFGVALGLPFALFALFPDWLKKLPKSGGWLGVVKKTLAFIELALALKFLSNADLVEHWGILKREVFIGAWILISIGLSLYLFGVFDPKEPAVLRNADNIPRDKKSNVRKALATLVAGLAISLLPGLTPTRYARLPFVSGFPPPLSYSIYGKKNIAGKGLEPDVINDYPQALALAKKMHKPLLIDFTGWACVNCRKMEEQVWSQPMIQDLIRENYILVSLYVDDRKKLPAVLRYQDQDLRTVGDQWALFQSVNFKQVTQPLYILLSPDEQLLNHPVGYTPAAGEYKDWLQCGLEAAHKK